MTTHAKAIAHGFRSPDPAAHNFMLQRAAMCAIGELLMLRDKLYAAPTRRRDHEEHLNNAIDELAWLLDHLR